MTTATEVPPMAKKGRPNKPTGKGLPVRIDADLVSKGKYLASRRGVSLTELLSDLLRPLIEREFRKAGKELMGGEE